MFGLNNAPPRPRILGFCPLSTERIVMYGLNTAPSRPRIRAFARFLWKGLLVRPQHCPLATSYLGKCPLFYGRKCLPGLNTAPSLPLFRGLENCLQMTSYYIGPHQPASKGKISITLWPQKPPQPRFWAINYNLDFFASSI